MHHCLDLVPSTTIRTSTPFMHPSTNGDRTRVVGMQTHWLLVLSPPSWRSPTQATPCAPPCEETECSLVVAEAAQSSLSGYFRTHTHKCFTHTLPCYLGNSLTEKKYSVRTCLLLLSLAAAPALATHLICGRVKGCWRSSTPSRSPETQCFPFSCAGR
jgi:hypothetical protein